MIVASSSMKSAVCTPSVSPTNESDISPESKAETDVTIATPQKAASAHGAEILTDPERNTERLKKIQETSTPIITNKVFVYPKGAKRTGIKKTQSLSSFVQWFVKKPLPCLQLFGTLRLEIVPA